MFQHLKSSRSLLHEGLLADEFFMRRSPDCYTGRTQHACFFSPPLQLKEKQHLGFPVISPVTRPLISRAPPTSLPSPSLAHIPTSRAGGRWLIIGGAWCAVEALAHGLDSETKASLFTQTSFINRMLTDLFVFSGFEFSEPF